jgi:hypothetical protein
MTQKPENWEEIEEWLYSFSKIIENSISEMGDWEGINHSR